MPGRDLEGIHFAMEYLSDRNRWVATQTGTPTGCEPPEPLGLTAEGKHVVVIGGGDTGADCVGNSLRQGAASITQLELLPEPPAKRPDDRTPWPLWPQKFRLSYAMEEAKAAGAGEQDFSVVTTHFSGDEDGHVRTLHYAQADAEAALQAGRGHRGRAKADLVLLAMGFLHPEQDLLDALGVAKDQRGNAKAIKPYTTSVEGVFAAGDARRGQSLIVWAINEGRQCARMVDRYLGELAGAAAPSRRRRRRGPGRPAAARRSRRTCLGRCRARVGWRAHGRRLPRRCSSCGASSSGLFARLALPGKDPMRSGRRSAVGIGGSLIAAIVSLVLFGQIAGFLLCLVFAVAILYFIRRSRGGGLTEPRRARAGR